MEQENAIALAEWKRRYEQKVQAAVKKAEEWVDLMMFARRAVNQQALADSAKSLRAKNVETLARLAKKRTPEHMEKLTAQFEATTVTALKEEANKQLREDQRARSKSVSQMANRQMFDRVAQEFLAQYMLETKSPCWQSQAREHNAKMLEDLDKQFEFLLKTD
jgi:uncharacterized protein with von Willebrand factor type A (vWA) domain